MRTYCIDERRAVRVQGVQYTSLRSVSRMIRRSLLSWSGVLAKVEVSMMEHPVLALHAPLFLRLHWNSRFGNRLICAERVQGLKAEVRALSNREDRAKAS